ncbi:ATP-binding protein [Sulfurirhabdus autotrophica]|uniref:Anti-sigma regulatory factor (Ser/Thr protein kinase) n=1 Tax=Sulfurirhabdus autotrophica TaxID=1706046 RepID=A0A4R3XWR5_9PROT|nr:ATP-binding protein [Sulfurirhabdus autotrophica]TCV83281.1 anti-sigma regulatory factor (Ser/Thr protein kinase) [Sulfurirhabdus autotrophica]
MSQELKIDSNECKLLFADPIQSESAGILLRSRLQASGRRMGFSDVRRENMVLVASEMVTNLIKHAGGKGMIQVWQQPGPALDIISFDFGPGVDDLALAQQDGYSTSKTLGKGLGSMQRLSDEFGIYTQQEKDAKHGRWHGTALWTRFYLNKHNSAGSAGLNMPAVAQSGFEIGVFSRALNDDRFNGDKIYLQQHGAKLRLLHLDGLGHGEIAQRVTSNLGCYLSVEGLDKLLAAVDHHLTTGERGAVAIAAEFDLSKKNLNVLGVGDMSAYVYIHDSINNLSFAPGILGREHKTPTATQLVFEKKTLFITASDGIRRGWDKDSFPRLFNQHPQLIAYVLGNVMPRVTDDQSICVIRLN